MNLYVNEFAHVVNVNNDSTFTVLLDPYDAIYRRVTSSKVGKIDVQLLEWLYSDGTAEEPDHQNELSTTLSGTTYRYFDHCSDGHADTLYFLLKVRKFYDIGI